MLHQHPEHARRHLARWLAGKSELMKVEVMDFARIAQRTTLYEKLMRLDKPIGTLLLLWPTLWALWIASGGRPGWMMVWIFSLGTLLMRSAGCVMNDLADRNFDAHVERTKDRPLAARAVGVTEALWLAAGPDLGAFCWC
jgi:4-hydroxybenzoate polyprenyltransferase